MELIIYEKADTLFKQHFKIPIKGFVDFKLSSITRKIQIDLYAFAEYLESRGYDENNESILEFTEREYNSSTPSYVNNQKSIINIMNAKIANGAILAISSSVAYTLNRIKFQKRSSSSLPSPIPNIFSPFSYSKLSMNSTACFPYDM